MNTVDFEGTIVEGEETKKENGKLVAKK